MPSFDRKTLEQEALRQGFRPGAFEKAARILAYLAEVDAHPGLRGRLCLIGGTAINMFLSDAPRLSVDADINYIGAEGRKEMGVERPKVENALREVGTHLGYKAVDVSKPYALDRFQLSYTSVYDQKDSLKIETNFLMRLPLQPVTRRSAHPFLSGIECEFPIASTLQIYAGKLKALVERCAPRDMFDVYRLVDSGGLNLDHAMRNMIVVYFATIPSQDLDVRKLTPQAIPWPKNRDLSQSLLPMLRNGKRLKVETLRPKIEKYVAKVLAFTKEQRRFLDEIAEGRLDGKILYPSDPTMADLVTRHPALIWRAQGEERRKSKS